jgi:5,10-methylenetetrahydromethanopterin reductase
MFSDAVRRADRYGFARIGTGDTQWHNMECFMALTLMALNSEKLEIGPRVTNPVTREPSVMASAIASLELVSNGRAVLAIGRGDSAVHNIGLKPATVEETRDSIIAVRELLEKGEPFTADGTTALSGRAPRSGGASRSASLQRDQECCDWRASSAIKF